MKKQLMLIVAFCALFGMYGMCNEKLTSPNGKIQVEITLNEKISYSVRYDGQVVLNDSPLSLKIENFTLGKNPIIKKTKYKPIDQVLYPVWGSRKEIRDQYNELRLDFKKEYSVEFRAYDNGVAYRFVTHLKEKDVKVVSEEVAYHFNNNTEAWLLDGQSYESNFKRLSLHADTMVNFENKNKIFLPAFVQASPKVKVAITEAGLHDYPSLFLQREKTKDHKFVGTFEKYALTTKKGKWFNQKITDEEADYIAVTSGKRDYPWRLMVISDDDRNFVDCDLVYQLSKPCALENTDWIKPGKVAWEWWHDYAVEGEDFKGGVNTEMYLYEIDFAARYGLEYLLIDWKWTDSDDITKINPDVDIKRITEYAQSKGVMVTVWCPSHVLHEQMDEALDLFKSLGIVGVKADFFGREDQTGIRMYEELAQATAKREMIIDFHGCTKPTGLSRTYPNVLNYEAVAGNEHNKLSKDKVTIDHRVMLPFTRGLVGPMDFTPGGMRNVQSGHNLRYVLPLVHGTRSGEMALFVLYNEPYKMICDAPSVYNREPEITHFISEIPTVWDDTEVLQAAFGEYLVEARRVANRWYLAGLTGEKAREITVNCDFLGDGVFKAKILKDGPNAGKIGTDYLFESKNIDKNSKLTFKMEKGGGFVVEIR